MQLLWILGVTAGLLAIFLMGARTVGGGRQRVANRGQEADAGGGRDLGARDAVDMTFAGDREEHHAPAIGAGAGNAVRAGTVGGDPTQSARPGLAPEAQNGESRVAPRTTGPERRSTATDPYAHAPVPGSNHLPPEGGVDLPDQVRP